MVQVDDDAIRAYAASCAGEDVPDLEPLSQGHLRINEGESKPVTVTAIRDAKNVNALMDGEILTFAPVGLTVVYGDNGAGKSAYASRHLEEVTPIVIALGSVGAAALATLPGALLMPPGGPSGWKTIASVVMLGIPGTGLAYIVYYSLLTGAGASRSILIMYLVPTFALAYGAVVLDEAITLSAVFGLALILGGVALASGIRRERGHSTVCEYSA